MEEQNELTKKLKELTNEFWEIDCLIRIAKELILNESYNKQDVQEEDISIICNILLNTTQNLSKKILELNLNNQ